MNELFYCNCGNRGPDGAECRYCHSYFAFQSHKKSIIVDLDYWWKVIQFFVVLLLGFCIGFTVTFFISLIFTDERQASINGMIFGFFASWIIMPFLFRYGPDILTRDPDD